jgi:hypothetical protein
VKVTNWVLVTAGVVALTWTVPDPGGLMAVIREDELMVKESAEALPNRTFVAPVKFKPFTVTEVPPAAGPATGTRSSPSTPTRRSTRSSATSIKRPSYGLTPFPTTSARD